MFKVNPDYPCFSQRPSLHLLAQLSPWPLLWLQYSQAAVASSWELRSRRIPGESPSLPSAAFSHCSAIPVKASIPLRLTPPIFFSFFFLPLSVNYILFPFTKQFAQWGCSYPSSLHEDLLSLCMQPASTCITSPNTPAIHFLELFIPFSIKGQRLFIV